ncbi:hypothetical protein TI04_12735 [Achromatium sp. WMS2]|nr:hypothetical protein TI04_12735 [Achromatium sp. WMS2]
MIILDTHAFVWLITGDSKIGQQSVKIAENALNYGVLAVSAIKFWELAMLCNRNRIKLHATVDSIRLETMNGGIREIPLDGEITVRAVNLQDFHADPADRFIVATAQHFAATLITADEKILAWQGELQRHDATK